MSTHSILPWQHLHCQDFYVAIAVIFAKIFSSLLAFCHLLILFYETIYYNGTDSDVKQNIMLRFFGISGGENVVFPISYRQESGFEPAGRRAVLDRATTGYL